MIFIALLLSQVSYYDIPDDRRDRGCIVAKHNLEEFLLEYHTIVTHKEVDWGGKLSADEAVVWRHEADVVAAPYLEDLEHQVDARICAQIASDGKKMVIDRVVRPRFGR